MKRLDEPRLLVSILPPDPLMAKLDFRDPAFLTAVLPKNLKGSTANAVGRLSAETVTSDALVMYADYGGQEPWRCFVALTRSGGVEVGFGETVSYELSNGVRAYRLFVLVHSIRLAIETLARLRHRIEPSRAGPYEVNIAIPGVEGAVLGGLASGWEEPAQAFRPPAARDKDALIRCHVEEWPQSTDELLLDCVERTCNAFGDLQRRYLPFGDRTNGPISHDYG